MVCCFLPVIVPVELFRLKWNNSYHVFPSPAQKVTRVMFPWVSREDQRHSDAGGVLVTGAHRRPAARPLGQGQCRAGWEGRRRTAMFTMGFDASVLAHLQRALQFRAGFWVD